MLKIWEKKKKIWEKIWKKIASRCCAVQVFAESVELFTCPRRRPSPSHVFLPSFSTNLNKNIIILIHLIQFYIF